MQKIKLDKIRIFFGNHVDDRYINIDPSPKADRADLNFDPRFIVKCFHPHSVEEVHIASRDKSEVATIILQIREILSSSCVVHIFSKPTDPDPSYSFTITDIL